MAYIPTSDPRRSLLALGGGAPGSAGAPVSGSASPPPATSSDGGQRFSALRGFFAANQPAADAQANALTAPIEKEAQGAVDLAAEAAKTPGSQGGAEKMIDATVARDRAREKVAALGSPGGLEGLLGEGRDATYTQGQRAADAYLFGRTPGVLDAASRWSSTLGALDPTYAPEPPKPVDNSPPMPWENPRLPKPYLDPVEEDNPRASGPGRSPRERY